MNFFNKLFGFKRELELEFDFDAFELERANNPLIKQLEENRAKYEKTIQERQAISNLSMSCIDLVSRYSKEIPDEDYEFFMLYEGMSAFLPISIKPFLKPWDSIYIYGCDPF